MRGVRYGLLFSLPFWAAIVLVWHLYPPTTMERITVYSGLIAGVVLMVAAFVFDKPHPSDPPCPDRFFNAFGPLDEDSQDRYDGGH